MKHQEQIHFNESQLNYNIKIVKKLKLAMQISTDEKFYKFWFEQLTEPENKELSKIEVFNKVNNLYKDTFGTDQGLYTNYNAFMSKMDKISTKHKIRNDIN